MALLRVKQLKKKTNKQKPSCKTGLRYQQRLTEMNTHTAKKTQWDWYYEDNSMHVCVSLPVLMVELSLNID